MEQGHQNISTQTANIDKILLGYKVLLTLHHWVLTCGFLLPFNHRGGKRTFSSVLCKTKHIAQDDVAFSMNRIFNSKF